MPNIDILLNAVNQDPNVVPGMTKDLGALEKVTGPVKQGFSGLQSAVGIGLKAAAGIGAAGIAGLGLVLKDSIGLAKIQINAEKQLDAVLASTGHAAGLTAQELKNMASGLQQVTNFGDEAIIQGQNLLLTFTNIGKDVFPAATETMLDMSQALGQDMKSSAIQLGKALNDPIAGVTALSRVGVSFTDQQKEQIKVMVEAGDVAGAQKLILAELAKEFGGSARAMADPAIQLSNAFGDLKEIIGAAVLPIINDLAQRAMPLVQNAMQVATQLIGTFRSTLEATGSPLEALKATLATFLPPATIAQISAFVDSIGNLKTQVIAIVAPITQAIGQFVSWKDILIVLAGVAASILIPAIVSLVATVAPVIAVFAGLVAATALLRNAWESNFGGIQEKTNSVFTFIQDFITERFGFVVDWWNENLPRMQEIAETVWNFIRGIFEGEGGEIQKFVQALGDTLIKLFDLSLNTILDLATLLLQLLTGDFEGAGETIKGIWERMKTTLVSIMTTLGPALIALAVSAVTGIKNTFSNVDWGAVGTAIINGIKAGVSSAAGALAQAAANAAKAALDAAKRLLGIGSPSKVFAEVGQNMMQGMAQGIQRYSAQPALAAAGAARQITNTYSIPVTVQMGNGNMIDAQRVARATGDELRSVLRELRSMGL